MESILPVIYKVEHFLVGSGKKEYECRDCDIVMPVGYSSGVTKIVTNEGIDTRRRCLFCHARSLRNDPDLVEQCKAQLKKIRETKEKQKEKKVGNSPTIAKKDGRTGLEPTIGVWSRG